MIKAWILKWIFGVVTGTAIAIATPTPAPVPIPIPIISESLASLPTPQIVGKPVYISDKTSAKAIVDLQVAYKQEVQEVQNLTGKLSKLEQRIKELENRPLVIERTISTVPVSIPSPTPDPRITVLEKAFNDFKDDQIKLHDTLGKQIKVLCLFSRAYGVSNGTSLHYRCNSDHWWLDPLPF